MKIISLICVMIVMALNCMPCADDDQGINAATAQLARGGNAGSHDHADACTPFCHCSCCASTVVAEEITSPEIPFKPTALFYAVPYIAPLSEVSLPIFQPPKLA